MEDIIAKLAAKDRKHKVTVKKKFIDEAIALHQTSSVGKRSAQVYVIVVNRDKDYDPVINQKIISQQNGIKRNLRLQKLEQAKKPKVWQESSDEEEPIKGEAVEGRSSVKE